MTKETTLTDFTAYTIITRVGDIHIPHHLSAKATYVLDGVLFFHGVQTSEK